MKYLFVLIAIFPLVVYAQKSDSIYYAQKIDSLATLANSLRSSGKYLEAIKLINEAADISKDQWGQNSTSYGINLHQLGSIYLNLGRYDTSEIIFLKSAEILGRTLGLTHPKYAASLHNLAIIHRDKGDYTKSEKYCIDALNIRSASGKNNSDYASSLNHLALLYYDQGEYEKSEQYFIEAKSILESVLGKEHPEYAQVLDNFGTLYNDWGKFDLAKEYYSEALKIRAIRPGKQSMEYGVSLNSLATLFFVMGDLVNAKVYFEECKVIMESVVGKEHQFYGAVTNNLAALYQELGQYADAEILYEESKNIRLNAFGPNHPLYAASLNNLGGLYFQIGLYEKAEQMFLKAISTMEETFNENHPDYASMLANLGVIYVTINNFSKAEPILLKVKSIREIELGKEHPDYAASLLNLGTLYLNQKEYELAQLNLEEAQLIYKKSLGTNHSEYSHTLDNIARLFYERGQLTMAEPLYLEAKQIREKAFGKIHRDYILSLENLSLLYWKMNQFSRVSDLMNESADLQWVLLKDGIQYLSEIELGGYIKDFTEFQNRIFSFTHLFPDVSSDLTELCYNIRLTSNGFLLNSQEQMKKALLNDTIASEKYIELFNLRKALAYEYTKLISERDSAGIMLYEEMANSLEKELMRSVEGYSKFIQPIEWKSVQKNLQTDEAAIEFIEFQFSRPALTDSILYAALLLRADEDFPRFIPLFEAEQLVNIIHNEVLPQEISLKDLYANKTELLNLLWNPLEQFLSGINRIFYSPSGLLHHVNLTALRSNPEINVSIFPDWIRVGSTRELIDKKLANTCFAKTGSSNQTNSAFLFGGINYDMDSIAFSLSNISNNSVHSTSLKEGNFKFITNESKSVSRGESENWPPLTYSGYEIDAISGLLNIGDFTVKMFKNYEANEEQFKSLGKNEPSPRILHIATHGFAYPDKTSINSQFLENELPFRITDNPMLRSGLVLAGGNYYWDNKRPLKGYEDGILVAYEVRDLNLRNTELAVLSACQTGIGDIVGSEGVYGLQRAFRIAGVKYLIVSLWPVPDEQTGELMSHFYSNWITKKLSLRESFSNAQETMRVKYTNPYLWAGFVLIE